MVMRTFGMSFVIRIGFLFVYITTAGKLERINHHFHTHKYNKQLKLHLHVLTFSVLLTMLLTRP